MKRETLRVLGIDPEKKFAGGEAQVLALTFGLRARGYEAELACDPDGQLWKRASSCGIRCHPVTIRNAIDPAGARALRRILKLSSYDVAHFHTARAHAMVPWIGGLARVKVVTRRMDYRPNRLFAPVLYNRMVDGVAAISKGVADALVAAGVRQGKIDIIPSGIDTCHFIPPGAAERIHARQALGIKPDEIAVGAVGALESRKGHRFLIESIGRLRNTAAGSRVRCFIAGAGSLASDLAAMAQRLVPGDGIRFLGGVSEIRDFLWALDIFAMPSLYEGLGVALLEAMACGLPTIATRVGGAEEAVAHGVSGYGVAPADSAALAEAIGRLIDAADLRVAMGRAGRERAVERYSIESTISLTLELYLRCLERR
jgi:glycosyltransferase involved in cell wall biosynthesis